MCVASTIIEVVGELNPKFKDMNEAERLEFYNSLNDKQRYEINITTLERIGKGNNKILCYEPDRMDSNERLLEYKNILEFDQEGWQIHKDHQLKYIEQHSTSPEVAQEEKQILEENFSQYRLDLPGEWFRFIENEKLVGSDVTSYLESLSKAGFKIAIDDFGTGYSNLQQLAKIPCDYLKIDRSFINEMEGGSIRSTLIPHIVKMAHQLNVPIVAEGVENSMQERALQEVGIKYAQGWAFGKPMTLPELIELFSRQQERE